MTSSYEYRQDSDLLYLTGVDQPETILVLMPGNRTKREILFVRPPDPKREHWNGHSLTAEEAAALTGIATVHLAPEFDRFLTSMFNRVSFDAKTRVAYVEDDEYAGVSSRRLPPAAPGSGCASRPRPGCASRSTPSASSSRSRATGSSACRSRTSRPSSSRCAR